MTASTSKESPWWLITSGENDWYTSPIQAPSATAAILVSEEDNKLEEGNSYEVYEVASGVPKKYRTEVTVQPV